MEKLKKILKTMIIITNILLATMFVIGYAEINNLTIAGILFLLAAIYIDW